MSDSPFPPPIEGGFSDFLEQNAYFVGLVNGFGAAMSRNLSAMTGDQDWYILQENPASQSAAISRDRLLKYQDVFAAVQAQIDAMPFWTNHITIGDDYWGPFPPPPVS